MAKIIIDASETIFGRLCSYAAKQALEGNEVFIVNSEKAIISGNKKEIIERFKKRRARGGTAQKGPNYPRLPFMILKRSIRGMFPNYREGVGRQAFLRVKCYEGIPKEFEKEKFIKVKTNKPYKYIELKELSERL